MTGWDACMLEPNSALRWIECHPSLAGYIEAVGTIAAFCLALLAPPLAKWLSERRAVAARQTRSSRVVISLNSYLVALIVDCNSRIEQLEKSTLQNEEDRQHLLDKISLVLPGPIDMLDPEGMGLDPVILSPITTTAARVRAFNGKVQIFRQLNFSTPDQWKVAREIIDIDLRQMKEFLEFTTTSLVVATAVAIAKAKK